MTSLLQRYNVGPRLAAAFAILIVLSGLVALIGYRGLSSARALIDDIVNQNMVKIRLSNDMMNANFRIGTQLRNLVLPTTAEDNQKFVAEIQSARADYSKARDELYAMPTTEQGNALRANIDKHRNEVKPLNTKVIDLANAGQSDEALSLMMTKSAPAMQRWQDAIGQNITLQDKSAAAAADAAFKSMDESRKLLIAGSLLVVLLSGALGLLITRSLTQPLSRATRAAESIANGKLDNDVDTQFNDETGRLLKAMSKMQLQLHNLISAQADMAKRHEEGQISFRMDAGAFPGDFGSMANDTNALVASHIKVKLQTIRLIERYAIGDLSEDMPQLPGEKGAITAAMNQVKQNLATMNTEIKQLAQAAANGDFTARGNAEQFQFDFRVMVESLNTLMATADGNLQSLSGLLQSIA
ncbi:MCP four helix bundle domain-containing protein, partial [Xanthomonas oryzae]